MRDRSITLGAPDEIYPGGGWDNGCMALEESVDLKLDHHNKDDIEIVDVEGEIDVYTAPRLRELLIDLVCTQERILKIFRITGLTKVFGIHDTVDLAIAHRKSEK